MNWWSRLWRRGQLEEQLDQELRFHLDRHAADLMARGIAAAEARRQARMALGGPEQVKEHCRDARGTRWLEDLWQDFRYAVRTLRQRPGFTAVALATLALGIGATTVMFTVIDSVLLKPLPFPHPERLAAVYAHLENARHFGQNLAYQDFLECQRVGSMDLAGWVYDSAALSEPGEAEYEQEFEISHNLFAVLGVRTFRGREFRADEDSPGGNAAAILDSLWQRHFGGDAGAVGANLVLDGKRYTVVGIAPPGLQLDGEGDIYTLLGQSTAADLRNRMRRHPVRGIGRLRAGATLAQPQAEMAAMGRALAEEDPEAHRGLSLRVQPLRPYVQDVQSTLWLLLGAVTLVLLIGCANVASLMLARAVVRERELAMRAALRAGRGRLMRLCLTESTLLGLGGGALGVALAAVALQPFLAFWRVMLPRAVEVHLDWACWRSRARSRRSSGLLFGLAPALRVPARGLEAALRAGSRGVAQGSRRRHGVLVSAEIALAVVLLVAAGMLGRTLLHLSALEPGGNVRNVMVARMALSPAILPNPARIRTAWDEVLENARCVPGVESVARAAAPCRCARATMKTATRPARPYRRTTGSPARRSRREPNRRCSAADASLPVSAMTAMTCRAPTSAHPVSSPPSRAPPMPRPVWPARAARSRRCAGRRVWAATGWRRRTRRQTFPPRPRPPGRADSARPGHRAATASLRRSAPPPNVATLVAT